MNNLILLGGGGHCESVIELIRFQGRYNILGVLDPSFDEGLKKVMDIPVLGKDEDIPKYVKKGCQFVITVGQIKSSKIREKLFNEVKMYGGELPTITAKTAYVSKDSVIGEGTVIMDYCFVNVSTNVGDACILNTGSILEHGCSVGDFTHVSTRVVLNGDVSCGKSCFIGSGTIVNQDINIGDGCIVASGSLVRKNIGANSTVAGNPIKNIE